MSRVFLTRLVFGLVLLGGIAVLPGRAFIEAPHSFGEIIHKSSNILAVTITAVDKEKKTIVYRKTQDLKGKHPAEVVKTLCAAELTPGEIAEVMRWAEVGKPAVMFYNGGAAEICFGTGWYQVNAAGEWWNMTHTEPFLIRSFYGRVPKLISLVNEVVAGKEVMVPCLRDTGNREDIFKKRSKSQKLKASLKLVTYDQNRDFAGYGGAEDISPVRGMPAFSQSVGFGRLDGRALGAQTIDFDGDGKIDVCLVAQNKLALYRNEGDSYSDVTLPTPLRGVKAACWGDLDGDNKPDLVVATIYGLKLFTNLGTAFRDDSSAFPPTSPAICGLALIDFDRDGKCDVGYADGFSGLKVLMNRRPDADAKAGAPKFGPWRAVGRFAPDNAFAKDFGPEKDADPKKTFADKSGAPIGWKEMKFTDGQPNDLKQFGGSGTNCCCYVARDIEAAAAEELTVTIGADDNCKLWLNGEQLFADGTVRPVTDRHKVVLKLKPGKNLLLMKVVQSTGEWAFYFGTGKVHSGSWFKAENDFGLGGAPSSPIQSLSVADLNGDGRPDLVARTATGLHPWLSKADGSYASQPLTALAPGDGAVAFGDVNADGLADAFVPSNVGRHRLLISREGRLVQAPAEQVAAMQCEASSGLIGDLNGDGQADLIVGVWRGPNRVLFGDGTGKFADSTEATGLHQKVYNSSALALGDLNNDGLPDLIMGNDAVESLGLFAAPAKALPCLRVEGVFGRTLPYSAIKLKDVAGKVTAGCCVGGSMHAAEGKYQLEWVGQKGEAMAKPVEIKGSLTRVSLAEEAKK